MRFGRKAQLNYVVKFRDGFKSLTPPLGACGLKETSNKIVYKTKSV